MTEPVNASGVVPAVAVRPWTGWSRVRHRERHGAVAGRFDGLRGARGHGGGRQTEPEYGGERSRGTSRQWLAS